MIASGSFLVYTLSFHRPLPILAAAIALVLIFDSQSKCTETFPHSVKFFLWFVVMSLEIQFL